MAMKAKPDCIVCMFKQALNTIKTITNDPEIQMQVLSELAKTVKDASSLNQTPAALSQPAYEIISRITGIKDPYAQNKAETNQLALSIMPEISNLVQNADDPLNAAVHAAVAGNIIDLGIGHKFDIHKDIALIMNQKFAINALEDFRAELRPGRTLLYLGDNAGEIVLDTLLVRQILDAGINILFSVKSGPVINDATMHDAEIAGMTKLTRVIETGSNDIGINWNRVSSEFVRAFETADIIVSKGHGNFECCNTRTENIYFLLKTKCDMVAQALNVKLGDIVFKHSR